MNRRNQDQKNSSRGILKANHPIDDQHQKESKIGPPEAKNTELIINEFIHNMRTFHLQDSDKGIPVPTNQLDVVCYNTNTPDKQSSDIGTQEVIHQTITTTPYLRNIDKPQRKLFHNLTTIRHRDRDSTN